MTLEENLDIMRKYGAYFTYPDSVRALVKLSANNAFRQPSHMSEGAWMKFIIGKELKDLLKKMLPYFNFLYYSEELKGICQLLEIFQEEVQNTKRSMGLLTFADVAALAIESLLKYPELRLIEKKSYKAIMIDEFQDDNILQKELLFLLAEKEELCSSRIPLASELNPEKLFFVGDEKQSIYKFRGADVEVFRKLSDELSGKATLSTNYRSEPALVAAFNTIFGGVKYPLAKQEEIEAYFAESSNCDVVSVFVLLP